MLNMACFIEVSSWYCSIIGPHVSYFSVVIAASVLQFLCSVEMLSRVQCFHGHWGLGLSEKKLLWFSGMQVMKITIEKCRSPFVLSRNKQESAQELKPKDNMTNKFCQGNVECSLHSSFC